MALDAGYVACFFLIVSVLIGVGSKTRVFSLSLERKEKNLIDQRSIYIDGFSKSTATKCTTLVLVSLFVDADLDAHPTLTLLFVNGAYGRVRFVLVFSLSLSGGSTFVF